MKMWVWFFSEILPFPLDFEFICGFYLREKSVWVNLIAFEIRVDIQMKTRCTDISLGFEITSLELVRYSWAVPVFKLQRVSKQNLINERINEWDWIILNMMWERGKRMAYLLVWNHRRPRFALAEIHTEAESGSGRLRSHLRRMPSTEHSTVGVVGLERELKESFDRWNFG